MRSCYESLCLSLSLPVPVWLILPLQSLNLHLHPLTLPPLALPPQPLAEEEHVNYSRDLIKLRFMEQRTYITPERPYPTPVMLASGYRAVATYSSVRWMEIGNLGTRNVKVSQETASTEFS